jgi:hypothetical protein
LGIDPIASNPGGASKLPEEKKKIQGESGIPREMKVLWVFSQGEL